MQDEELLDAIVESAFDSQPAAPADCDTSDVAFVVEKAVAGDVSLKKTSRAGLIRQYELDTASDPRGAAVMVQRLRSRPPDVNVVPVLAFAYQPDGTAVAGVRWRQMVKYAGSA